MVCQRAVVMVGKMEYWSVVEMVGQKGYMTDRLMVVLLAVVKGSEMGLSRVE